MSPTTLLSRALRLRCVYCGGKTVYQSFLRMEKTCRGCGTTFEREPGFFLGAIYFNYGVTALITTAGYLCLRFVARWPSSIVLSLSLAFTLLFPIWFSRIARCLWLGFDQWVDPRSDEQNPPSDKTTE